MRTKLSLALSAVLAAFLFAGAATAGPRNGNTINQFVPKSTFNSGMTKKSGFKIPTLKKNKKSGFKIPTTKKKTGFKIPYCQLNPSKCNGGTGGNGGNAGSGGNGGVTVMIDPCIANPSLCNIVSGGGGGGNGHNHHGHHHGFPGLQVGLGFGYNVTEVAPAVPFAAYPMACVVPPAAATQPTLLDRVVARLVQLDELNRRDLIEDDEYEVQKTVVLLTLVSVTVAQEVGVAYALQVLKCIEAQDLISSNEYDAKRKEFVAIL